MPRLLFRLLPLLAFIGLLSACGGGSVKLKWDTTTGAYAREVAVLANGTQLAWTIEDRYVARDRNGIALGEVILPRTGTSHVIALGDHFAFYGRSGPEVWRVLVNTELMVVSDSVLHTNTATASVLGLRHVGDTTLLLWYDNNRFTYFIEGQGPVRQLSEAESVKPNGIGPAHHYWYADATNANLELVEIDLATGSELQRGPLPAAFADARTLMVNAGFVVGIPLNATTGEGELLVWNRNSGQVNLITSPGGFGDFDLNLLGQDGEGTIYYYYLATLPHSGFKSGLYVRAISSTQLQAWEHKLASSAVEGAIKLTMLPSGLRMLFSNSTITSVTAPTFTRKIHSRYVGLTGNGTVTRSFALKPVEETVTPIVMTTQSADGYRANAFGVDASGSVYLYGQFDAVDPASERYFAGMY